MKKKHIITIIEALIGILIIIITMFIQRTNENIQEKNEEIQNYHNQLNQYNEIIISQTMELIHTGTAMITWQNTAYLMADLRTYFQVGGKIDREQLVRENKGIVREDVENMYIAGNISDREYVEQIMTNTQNGMWFYQNIHNEKSMNLSQYIRNKPDFSQEIMELSRDITSYENKNNKLYSLNMILAIIGVIVPLFLLKD